MTAPVAVDYRQFTDTELATARAETLAALSADDPTEEDTTRADEITAEIERRNAITEATNARRLQLAGLEITQRARPVDRPPANDGEGGGHRTHEPEDFNLRAAMQPGLEAYRARGMQGSMVLGEVPDIRALVDHGHVPDAQAAGAGDRRAARAAPDGRRPARPAEHDGRRDRVRARTSFTETAAEVAEGTAKPESALTFDVVAAALATIATWIPITRQAAEDRLADQATSPGALPTRSKSASKPVLNGNGTAPNIRGSRRPRPATQTLAPTRC